MMSHEHDALTDAVLRAYGKRDAAEACQAAEALTAVEHLDVNELNAFVENRLTLQTRVQYARHLAACLVCRQRVAMLARIVNEAVDETRGEVVVSPTSRFDIDSFDNQASDAATHTGQTQSSLVTASDDAPLNQPSTARDVFDVPPALRETVRAGFFSQAFNHHTVRYALPILLCVIAGAGLIAWWSNNRETSIAEHTREATTHINASSNAHTNQNLLNQTATDGTSRATIDDTANMNANGNSASSLAANHNQATSQTSNQTPAQTSSATVSRSREASEAAPVADTFGTSDAVAAKRQVELSKDTSGDVPTGAMLKNQPAVAAPPSPNSLNDTVDVTAGQDEIKIAPADDAARKRVANRRLNQLPATERPAAPSAAMNPATPVARADVGNETRVTTRRIGTREFRLEGATWIDENYRPPMRVRNVRRASSEFQSLVRKDTSLNVVAAELGGTVIIVIDKQAYRIQ